MRTALGGLALAVAVALGGCGGPISDDELERGVEALGSLAAEGQLVARGVVQDRTKVTFVRVELRALSDDAQHEAEKLSDAEARAGNAAVKAQAVQLAQDIDSALGDLRVAPTDRHVAADVGKRLSSLTDQADRLAERL